MFEYTNDTPAEVKRYLQVDLVPLIDRRTEEGDEIWDSLVSHGCFNGNDSMMVFERFWGEGVNIEDLQNEEYVGKLELFMTRKLHEWGYRYNEDHVLYDTKTGEKYDGTLLNITW